MQCAYPYQAGVEAHPCGRCMPCRVNRQEQWVTRMMLESYQHGDSAFMTLTYAPEHLPPGNFLKLRHIQRFIKRLRYMHGKPVRYFMTGEYGTDPRYTERAHYHGILYGLHWALHRPTIELAWDMGFISTGEVNEKTCRYVAGYVTKDSRGDERPTIFATMSRRPGIGGTALLPVAERLRDVDTAGLGESIPTLPSTVRVGGRQRQLGRYLGSKVALGSGGIFAARVENARQQRIQEVQHEARTNGVSQFVERQKATRDQSEINARTRVNIYASKRRGNK